MKSLIATTAIALFVLGTGTANATIFGDTNQQQQQQGQIQGQLQGQKQNQANEQNTTFQNRRMLGQAPGIYVGQPSFGAAHTGCYIIGKGHGYAVGLGAGTGSNDVASAGIGWSETTTMGELNMLGCNYNAVQMLASLGLYAEATLTACQDPSARAAMDLVDRETCRGARVIVKAVIDPYETPVLAAYGASPSGPPLPVAASSLPIGNAVNGKCAKGFDPSTGQCAW